jgi:peptidyl-tRNA hydrolase, PTH1 family
MSGNKICLVIGLGNPGDRYQTTRHNIGFMVLDKIAGAYNIPVNKKKFNADYGKGVIDRIDTILVKPMTFMNKSGFSVIQFVNFFKVSNKDVLVIHDDIDLEFGRIKIKEKGGDGGHKGVRSILDALGSDDFCRIRLGVGRSAHQIDVSDHVLGSFNTDEKMQINRLIDHARDAVVTILCQGTKEGMNRFNNRKFEISS